MTITTGMMVLTVVVALCAGALVYGVMAAHVWVALAAGSIGLLALILVFAIANAMNTDV